MGIVSGSRNPMVIVKIFYLYHVTLKLKVIDLVHMAMKPFHDLHFQGHGVAPRHPQVQPHISCHPRRAPLASNQEKDRLQNRPYGPTLLGWCCAEIPDGTVPSCRLSRRSTMSPVGFSWWPRCSEVSASDIRPSGLRCLRPPNLELSSAQD